MAGIRFSASVVRMPSEMFAVGESRLAGYASMGANGVLSAVSWFGYDEMMPGLSWRTFPYPLRHGKNYNQLCCDGHIEAMPPTILFKPAITSARWHTDNQQHPEDWPVADANGDATLTSPYTP
jgi:hypothetical protein